MDLSKIKERWSPEYWRQHEAGMREQWMRQAAEDVASLLCVIDQLVDDKATGWNKAHEETHPTSYRMFYRGVSFVIFGPDLELWWTVSAISPQKFIVEPIVIHEIQVSVKYQSEVQ